MTRAAIFSLLVCFGCFGQSPRPAFEVASVKLNPNCGNGNAGGGMPAPGRLNLPCSPVRNLIQIAYVMFADGMTQSTHRIQVVGGPPWIDSEAYDVLAMAPKAPVAQMHGPMLQALLEERFGLTLHKGTRDASIYSLTVAKNGPKLQATAPGSCIVLDLNHLPAPPAPGQPMPNYCGRGSVQRNGPNRTIDAHGMTIAGFADRLVDIVNRPVIDKTGLTGLFDIHLEFAPDDGRAADPDSAGPSIFTAMQEQLGLKFSAATDPVEVLIVDEIHKPSEN